MHRVAIVPLIAVIVALPARAQAAARAPLSASHADSRAAVREYRVEAAHSTVGFAIGFLGHPVRGRFDDVRGTITYVPGDVGASSITVAIGVASINTGSRHRDEHLRSADFFDAATYPTILFSSRAARRLGASGFAVTGPLTMHGITREITIPFRETLAPVSDPHGSDLVFFTGAIRLARRDFNIMGGSRFNDWFDDIRQRAMGDSVDVTLEVEGWDVDYARSPRWAKAVEQLIADGPATRVAAMRALVAQHPDTLRDAEWELDQAGRALLQLGRPADALELFRFVAELFPKSSAAQAALARGYEAVGDRERASAQVDRALAIDPAETRAIEIRRRLGRAGPAR